MVIFGYIWENDYIKRKFLYVRVSKKILLASFWSSKIYWTVQGASSRNGETGKKGKPNKTFHEVLAFLC